MPNPEDPFWVQLPPATLVLRLQLSPGDEPARPAQARGAPAAGLLGPEPATPWEGIPRPTGATSRAQPVLALTGYNMQLPLPLPCPQRKFRKGCLPVASSLLLTWGPAEPGPRVRRVLGT